MKPNLSSIAVRLPAAIAALAILVAGVITYLGYAGSSSVLQNQASARLGLALDSKKTRLTEWLTFLDSDLDMMRDNPTTSSALKGFQSSWSVLQGDRTADLQRLYIDDNPNPAGQRALLDMDAENSPYGLVHKRFHPYFRQLRELRGYYDIFLFNVAGDLLYSVSKERDLGTNFQTGPFKDSGLGRAFRSAMTSPGGQPAFVDFAPYAPSGGQPAAFMAIRVDGRDGQPIGVVAFQMPDGAINSILSADTGTGNHTIATLIGPDGLRRNTSTFSDAAVLDPVAESDQVRRALAGETGMIERSIGQDGEPVMAVYGSVDAMGTPWALVVEEDLDEMMASVVALRNRSLMFLGLAAAAAVLLGWLTARGIARPLGRLGQAMDRIAAHDFDTEVPDTRRGDEVGTIARNLEDFRARLQTAEAERRMTVFKSRAFAGSSISMMMVDTDCNIIDANDASREMFSGISDQLREHWPGFDANRLVGQNIDQFHSNPSHQRKLLSDRTKLPMRTEVSIGNLRLEVHVSAIIDDDDQLVGAIAEWKDVRELRMNQSILDAMRRSQVMVEYDAEFRVMRVNENFTKVFGYTEADAKGRGFEELFSTSEDTRIAKERLRSGKSVTRKVRRSGKNDAEVWVEVAMNPIFDARGNLDGVVEIATDLTAMEKERIAAEEERRRAGESQKQVVEDLKRGLAALAEGNLTVNLDQPFSEEYDQLRHDYNAALEKLTEVTAKLIATTSNITSGAVEMSQAADDLSRRTENQAATLEETAAALDQLTSSVRSAADGAGEADRAVRSARESAEASGKVVLQAVDAMSEIEKSSDQIGQIIGVIDDIAFQTNLLALNAGVEAARAGEAGRGFAVVASEVRSLAQRSSEAAKEIKALISASSGHVERGVSLVGQAGDALNRIVESVGNIAGLVGDIAASSTEQSTGLSEINTGVNQLDEVTQQNAAMVEESTAASHSLKQEAEVLSELVALFRVRQGAGAEVVGLAARPRSTAGKAPARTSQPATSVPAATGTDSGWEDF